MAFYNKTDDLPRDPSAIDQDYTRSDGMVSAVIVLLIIAAAFGLYFLYGGSGSTTRTVNEPSTTQLSPATPAPTPPHLSRTRHHRLGYVVVAASLFGQWCRDCLLGMSPFVRGEHPGPQNAGFAQAESLRG